MPKRLLNYNPISGIKTYHEYLPDTKQRVITQEGETDPVIDFNKEIQNTPMSEYRRKRDMWHVAHIFAFAAGFPWLVGPPSMSSPGNSTAPTPAITVDWGPW